MYSKFTSTANEEENCTESRKLCVTLPPIPLERPERTKMADGNYVSFKLRAVPTNPGSQLYSLSVQYYATSTPEQWILFRKNLSKVLVGQNITTGPPTYAMTRRILEGSSLAKFEDSMIVEHMQQEFLEFCERLEATEDIFEEHTSAKCKANPRDCYSTNEGKRALANRSSGKPRNTNNKNLKFCRLHGQQQSHDTGSCKVLLDQADKMKAAWKTQPQQYQKNCYNANYKSKMYYQKNTGEREKERDFNSTEKGKTQYEHAMEKRLKQQIDHYMASVTKTDSLTKGSTLDLEKFKDNDDLISMDEMTIIEDLNSDNK